VASRDEAEATAKIDVGGAMAAAEGNISVSVPVGNDGTIWRSIDGQRAQV
jgi:hypothetical protein